MSNEPKDQRVPVMMGRSEVERIDRWRGKQLPIPSRSEAIRQLVAKALSTEEKRR